MWSNTIKITWSESPQQSTYVWLQLWDADLNSRKCKPMFLGKNNLLHLTMRNSPGSMKSVHLRISYWMCPKAKQPSLWNIFSFRCMHWMGLPMRGNCFFRFYDFTMCFDFLLRKRFERTWLLCKGLFFSSDWDEKLNLRILCIEQEIIL